MMLCEFHGCEREKVYKNFCSKHYMQARRHSPVFKEYLEKRGNCQIAGCSKKELAKKMCAMHYARNKLRGDPLFINPKCNRDGLAKERNRIRVAKWKKENWEIYKLYLRASKRRVKQATPVWVNKKNILEIYKNCPKGHHVDHIVPLRGENVSGLHVPWNLQYLTKEENLRKGSSFYAETNC